MHGESFLEAVAVHATL